MSVVLLDKPQPLLSSLLDIRKGKPIAQAVDEIRTRALGELLMAWWCGGNQCMANGKPFNAWATVKHVRGGNMVGDLRVLLAHHAVASGHRAIPHLLVIVEGQPFVSAVAANDPKVLGAAFLAWLHHSPQSLTETITLTDGSPYRYTLAIKALMRHNLGLFERWVMAERRKAQAAPSLVVATGAP
jgi:hypothetical protein